MRESTVIEAHEFRAMATGQQVQGIGDTRLFLDADVEQTKQMFDNPDGILVREAIKGAQDPFELKNYGQWYEHLRGFGQKSMGNQACLADSESAGSFT